MKKLFLLIISACVTLTTINSQNIDLTFNAIDNADYVQLDSIKVMNRTQGGDTVLYWPDTVLTLYLVGNLEIAMENSFHVFQNYPNPVAYQTTISLYVPEKDNVNLIVTDILGRVVLKTDRVLKKGLHSFRFTPNESSLFFFTALWRGTSSNIKILNSSLGIAQTISMEYLGSKPYESQFKSEEAIQDFNISIGDELLFIGYYDTLQSGILDSLGQSKTHTFQFAYNIPCPGTPTIEYDGQVYNTVQIMSQCWLKENLNVGTMIAHTEEMTDNDVLEKYCYNNNPDSCAKYGGLYQWDETMQYTDQKGVQGICPPGWHIPSDEDWSVLEGAVDSQYAIGDAIWDEFGNRGFDAGTNLKTTTGWDDNGNGTDLFGFSYMPPGMRSDGGGTYSVTRYGFMWTSNYWQNDWVRARLLYHNETTLSRGNTFREYGISVRCIKD